MKVDINLTYQFMQDKQLKQLAFALLIKDTYQSSFKDYIHHLRGAILKDKYLKAQFIQSKLLLSKNKRENIRNRKDLKIVRNIEGKFNNYKIDEHGFKYKQTILNMAKEFNCSIAELYTTIKYLVKKGYLKVTNNIKRLCVYFGGEVPTNCFIYKCSIYLAECNYYSLNIDYKK